MHLIEQIALAAPDALDTKGIEVSLSTVWFTFLLSVAGPIIVGLITKRFVEGHTKALLLLGVTVILQTLTEVGPQFNLWELLTKIAMAFILAVGLHYQFLKPGVSVAGVTVLPSITAQDGLANRVLPDIGIGKDHGGNDDLPDPDLIRAHNEANGIVVSEDDDGLV